MKKNSIIVAAFLLSAVLFITSCQKETGKPYAQPEEMSSANTHTLQKTKKKIYVSNLEELYAAVNDPGRAGTEVILAAGTYVLNASYPNGGRLELQTDMSLRGQPGNSDAAIIDQSSLPTSSFVIPAGRTGGIRMGKGTNSLEWLSTVGGAVSANPFSVINTDLLSTETNIRILHVYINVNGSNLGINLSRQTKSL